MAMPSARGLVAMLLLALCATAAEEAEASCTRAERHRNEATARIVFEEILGKGRFDENEHIYHPQFVVRGLTRDVSRAEDRAAGEGWRKMAPDLKVELVHILSDCDLVAVHWLSSGTNTGEGNGFPATGRKVRLRGMTFFRFEAGRIIEEWSAFDMLALLRQLGLERLP